MEDAKMLYLAISAMLILVRLICLGYEVKEASR